ncbi:hypothetical protein AURDEDRAFT_131136 [Auricularia subglabra TFB-10046 SS5]|uniref:Uncharacterized protein n=1 Tax=Auricularia subglabra (strain TFB-10046 / SS5) TaxID=717982 RepID=J0LD84_AURST|nr:hypothetical protein AURDEDRAFT_131136 [Auricularia subglabra TFB-10046 SS5]
MSQTPLESQFNPSAPFFKLRFFSCLPTVMSALALARGLGTIHWNLFAADGFLLRTPGRTCTEEEQVAINYGLDGEWLMRRARTCTPACIDAHIVLACLTHDIHNLLLRILDREDKRASLRDEDDTERASLTKLMEDLEDEAQALFPDWRSAAVHVYAMKDVQRRQPVVAGGATIEAETPTSEPNLSWLPPLPSHPNVPELIDGEFPYLKGGMDLLRATTPPRGVEHQPPAPVQEREPHFLTHTERSHLEDTNTLIKKRADESANHMNALTVAGKQIAILQASVQQLMRHQAGMSTMTLKKPDLLAKFIPEMTALVSQAAQSAPDNVDVEVVQYGQRLLSHCNIVEEIKSKELFPE